MPGSDSSLRNAEEAIEVSVAMVARSRNSQARAILAKGGHSRRAGAAIPPEMAEVETLAREAAPEAIRRLAELMHSDDGRISIACTAILDRDFRKPTVAVGLSGIIGHHLTQLADAEFMAIVAGDEFNRRYWLGDFQRSTRGRASWAVSDEPKTTLHSHDQARHIRSKHGALRCRLHGRPSTGPKTTEGERIAQGQRRRWEAWRSTRQPVLPGSPMA